MIYHRKINEQFSFNFSFKINFLEKDWSCVNTHNIYLSVAYLKALEKSEIPYVKFVYLVAYQDDFPVAIFYFQHLKVTNDVFEQKKIPKKLALKFTANLLTLFGDNLLLCGNFFATGTHGFVFSKKIPNKISLSLVKHLKNMLYDIDKSLSVNFIMFKEFYEDGYLSLQHKIKKQYACFEIDVHMVLKLQSNWVDFDSYLESMKTKYRAKAKKIYKNTTAVVMKNFTATDIYKYQVEIKHLYLSVVGSSNFNLVKLSAKSFYHLKLALSDNFVFRGYFLDNQLIAFSSAFINGASLDAGYVGIDYKANEFLPIYQRILYDYVRLGIAQKSSILSLGRTAETIKSNLGAIPIAMVLYIKHNKPISHALLKPTLSYVSPSPYQIRNPFKRNISTHLE